MKLVLAAFLFPLFILVARAQQPSPEQRVDKTDDRVIVNTNLVQVDAVVTDKNNKPVTDLQPGDFELIEDGHVRPIAAFSYINLVSSDPQLTNVTRNSVTPLVNARPPDTHAARPENVRRAIAIVVDDFGLSFESIARLRSALEKFVLTHTMPTDFIAVIRTSGGPGAIQQFTTNRAQIIATIRRIRWYPTGRGRMSAIDSIVPLDHDDVGNDLQGYNTTRPPDLSSKEFMGGSLGALYFVVNGLARFPGRKSIVLISEKLPLTTRDAQISGGGRALDKLIQTANQYSIVISTIDARGLPKAGLTADDNQYDLAANQIDKRSLERRITFRVQQDTLSYLAQETGGVFVHGSNDLTVGLRRTVDSEQGYYLLAFRPEDDNKEQARLYKVSLRLKRPDLVLRSRAAFHKFVPQRDIEPPVRTKQEILRDALSSPFVKEDLRLKLTALFTGSGQVRVLLHLNGEDVDLARSSNGTFDGSLDIAAVAFDDNGKVAQQLAQARVLSVPGESYESFVREGMVYSLTLPIKRAGPYQVRVAVRDSSGRVGSDSQFVEVPEPSKSRLAVTGFIVQGAEASDARTSASDQSTDPGVGDRIKRNPAVRQFFSGDVLHYSYLIYGAQQRAKGNGNLLSQVRLFRDADQVFASETQQVRANETIADQGILAGGSLRLGSALKPGEYFLQVIVTDKSAPVERQVVDQWVDFAIVK